MPVKFAIWPEIFQRPLAKPPVPEHTGYHASGYVKTIEIAGIVPEPLRPDGPLLSYCGNLQKLRWRSMKGTRNRLRLSRYSG
jgi:hypothetical protein